MRSQQNFKIEEELHNMYSSLNIIRGDEIRENEMGGEWSTN